MSPKLELRQRESLGKEDTVYLTEEQLGEINHDLAGIKILRYGERQRSDVSTALLGLSREASTLTSKGLVDEKNQGRRRTLTVYAEHKGQNKSNEDISSSKLRVELGVKGIKKQV